MISKLTMQLKKESVVSDLGKVKSEMKDIIKMIESIENEEGNMTDGRGLIHRTNNVMTLVSHLNRKTVDLSNTLTEYAFELGREFAEEKSQGGK